MGAAFANLAQSGPLLLAVGAAALAGLVSFLSPCVLPLVPGYLSYVTGLAGADLEGRSVRKGPLLSDSVVAGTLPNTAAGGTAADTAGAAVGAATGGAPTAATAGAAVGAATAGAATAGAATAGAGAGTVTVERPGDRGPSAGRGRSVKGRVLAGTLLFIAGFTAVYLLTAILLAGVGQAMLAHRRALEVAVGLLIIVLGLSFLGLVPGLQREFRLHRLPAAGLLGAPVFGAVFALSWAPCTGPTLGAVLGMATVGGQTDRAVILAAAYCLGLGLPFVVFGLSFSRLLGLFRAVRRNSRWVTRVGGALLILVGLALVTGGWQSFIIWLQTTVGPGEVGI
ncbi:cytochrome c biogenesis CcdA family protein [Plantactinospora siamensis]|uniref:Cytochrome c biogenesis CcdA family protein n=1 Tax=Plantactinospora siamensis TaxID=555372 RepID=A0ABV6NT35_9ACTN